MKVSKSLLLIPALFLLFAACSQPATDGDKGTSTTATTETASEAATTTETAAKKPAPAPLVASFDCKELSDMDDPNGPRVEVSLLVNGEKHLIETVTAATPFESSEYAQYQVPDHALAACGGWFAGGGDYFYAVQDGENVVVMAGWQDEGQEDDGFHYEVKQVIPLSGK